VGPKADFVAQSLGISNSVFSNCDLALFVVSAKDGFSAEVTTHWSIAREQYLPSVVIVVDLEEGEIDFEDMSAIISKTLDPVVTPYLILHSEEGFPTALIDLQTLQITDYTMGLKRYFDSDPEHKDLVAEFREEYLDTLRCCGKDGFEQGLLFPAIPLSLHIKLGVEEIQKYLNRFPFQS
jgi:translation elongation factor EF-G